MHRVTTVVITRDRLPDLQRSLPRHEPPVVVVDNASTDGTAAWIAEHLPYVEVIELEHNLGAVARNVGVEAARTPYVAFADDDSWWGRGALETAADLFEAHPRLAVVAGRVLVGDDEHEDPVCDLMRNSPLGRPADLPGPRVLGFVACGAVVRREAFLAAGGFDEVVFFLGEEERLALDLTSTGWVLCFVPDVVAHHHPSPVRDPAGRTRRAHRNRILTALMRRPWPVVARTTYDAFRDGRSGTAGARDALPAVRSALARRRVVPADVEAARRLLDRPGA